MEYLQFGYALLKEHPQQNIASEVIEGARIWVKKSSPSKRTFWHALQGVCASILRQPILSVTAIKGGTNSIQLEAGRIEIFREKGVIVPKLYAVDDHMMVLSHLGDSLAKILDEHKNPVYRKQILMKAVTALAALHAQGLAHGKPYLRDMTLADGQVGFIDLEENPLDAMPLAEAQARDLWLFLCAAAKYARLPEDKYSYDPAVITALFGTYKAVGNRDTLNALKRFVQFLKPIGYLLEKKPLWRLIGSDARRAVFVNGLLSSSRCFSGNV